MDKGVIFKKIYKYIFVRIIIFIIWNINGFTFVWNEVLFFVLRYNFVFCVWKIKTINQHLQYNLNLIIFMFI